MRPPTDLVAAVIAQESQSSSGAALVQFAILLMVPLALYFLMIRPQRKRMRETAALQASLGVGDEVITSSGLYGFIVGVESDLFWIEIDDDVQIRVAKAAVQGRVSAPGAAADGSEKPAAE
jgi:preprotein translocase subunit YajC